MTDDAEWDGEDDTGSENPLSGERSLSQEILELDHVYEALGHPRRRYLCYTLFEDTA